MVSVICLLSVLFPKVSWFGEATVLRHDGWYRVSDHYHCNLVPAFERFVSRNLDPVTEESRFSAPPVSPPR
jgi:hypothetical protein